MGQVTVRPVGSVAESKELDALLWEVLWKPLGFPRAVRDSFKLDGKESLELIAAAEGRIAGGLVSNWVSPSEVEIRHIAVCPEVQRQGIGRRLVAALIRIAGQKGCRRVQTIARSTSREFFRALGFAHSSVRMAEHPVFKRHGITFELMVRDIEPSPPADGPALTINSQR